MLFHLPLLEETFFSSTRYPFIDVMTGSVRMVHRESKLTKISLIREGVKKEREKYGLLPYRG